MRRRLERLTIRSRKFAAASVLGLALVALIFGIKANESIDAARDIHSSTPTSSFHVQNDPKPLPKVAEKSSNSNNDPPTTNISSSEGNQSAVPGMKQEDAADECSEAMAQSQLAYTREVQKEKSLLDSTISSITFGVGITSQYVADYNRHVSTIFSEYQSSAKSQNCTWPVKEPALLQPTYSR